MRMAVTRHTFLLGKTIQLDSFLSFCIVTRLTKPEEEVPPLGELPNRPGRGRTFQSLDGRMLAAHERLGWLSDCPTERTADAPARRIRLPMGAPNAQPHSGRGVTGGGYRPWLIGTIGAPSGGVQTACRQVPLGTLSGVTNRDSARTASEYDAMAVEYDRHNAQRCRQQLLRTPCDDRVARRRLTVSGFWRSAAVPGR